MAHNILGINPFHHGSACVLSDGKVIYYLEEERLTRKKYDPNPFKIVLNLIEEFTIDEVAIAGINHRDCILPYSEENLFYSLLHKLYPKLKITNYSDNHHLLHFFQSYVNSGFSNPLGIIIDSGGSATKNIDTIKIENLSIFNLDNNSNPTTLHKEYTNYPSMPNEGTGISMTYDIINYILGFKVNECGKTMGLSSYGSLKNQFPPLFKGKTTDPNLLSKQGVEKESLNISLNKEIFPLSPNLDFHKSKSNCTSYEIDLAWRVQNDTQQLVGDYIEKSLQETGLKQVCCAGGYFLNCVTNYYLLKRFPDVEFYFEPIANDAGTAIGVALYRWHELGNKVLPTKQNTLYYGPKYSNKKLQKSLKKYVI